MSRNHLTSTVRSIVPFYHFSAGLLEGQLGAAVVGPGLHQVAAGFQQVRPHVGALRGVAHAVGQTHFGHLPGRPRARLPRTGTRF